MPKMMIMFCGLLSVLFFAFFCGEIMENANDFQSGRLEVG